MNTSNFSLCVNVLITNTSLVKNIYNDILQVIERYEHRQNGSIHNLSAVVLASTVENVSISFMNLSGTQSNNSNTSNGKMGDMPLQSPTYGIFHNDTNATNTSLTSGEKEKMILSLSPYPKAYNIVPNNTQNTSSTSGDKEETKQSPSPSLRTYKIGPNTTQNSGTFQISSNTTNTSSTSNGITGEPVLSPSPSIHEFKFVNNISQTIVNNITQNQTSIPFAVSSLTETITTEEQNNSLESAYVFISLYFVVALLVIGCFVEMIKLKRTRTADRRKRHVVMPMPFDENLKENEKGCHGDDNRAKMHPPHSLQNLKYDDIICAVDNPMWIEKIFENEKRADSFPRDSTNINLLAIPSKVLRGLRPFFTKNINQQIINRKRKSDKELVRRIERFKCRCGVEVRRRAKKRAVDRLQEQLDRVNICRLKPKRLQKPKTRSKKATSRYNIKHFRLEHQRKQNAFSTWKAKQPINRNPPQTTEVRKQFLPGGLFLLE